MWLPVHCALCSKCANRNEIIPYPECSRTTLSAQRERHRIPLQRDVALTGPANKRISTGDISLAISLLEILCKNFKGMLQ